MDAYTDTGGTDWGGVIGAALGAWSNVETSKNQVQANQAQQWQYPAYFRDPQAMGQSYTAQQSANGGTLKTALIVGGVLAAGLLVWKLAK